VVEYAPQSEEAAIFRDLARKVMENDVKVIPTPVEELPELEELYRDHLVRAEAV
jgi:nitrogenase iron protein NifH